LAGWADGLKRRQSLPKWSDPRCPSVPPSIGSRPKDCDLPYSGGVCGNLRLFCCVLEAWGSRCCCAPQSRPDRGQPPPALTGDPWAPREWAYPGVIDRESADVLHNVWENQWYSCC
jgi:hypothetical protein